MQLAYTQYQNAGIRGLLYDLVGHDTMSYSAQGAVPMGVPVALGTNKERQVIQAITGVGMGALVIGVSIMQSDAEQDAAGVIGYADKETVSVLKKGRIWVDVNDAVTAGNVANLHLATGRFTDDAVAAGIEAFTQIKAKFLTSTAGAGLAVIDFTQV
ncbi:MAG: hypothetical protein JWR85_4187 [Marmoricola sp.]|jgi:hypothetical protein|nr:hypothetical protein [Marmoricola sp.]